MTATRFYVVEVTDRKTKEVIETRLVEATSQAQAINHVTKPHHSAHAASSKEIAALMTKGVKVEDATKDPE